MLKDGPGLLCHIILTSMLTSIFSLLFAKRCQFQAAFIMLGLLSISICHDTQTNIYMVTLVTLLYFIQLYSCKTCSHADAKLDFS